MPGPKQSPHFPSRCCHNIVNGICHVQGATEDGVFTKGIGEALAAYIIRQALGLRRVRSRERVLAPYSFNPKAQKNAPREKFGSPKDGRLVATRSSLGPTLASRSRSLDQVFGFLVPREQFEIHSFGASLQKTNNLTKIYTLATHGLFFLDFHSFSGSTFYDFGFFRFEISEM